MTINPYLTFDGNCEEAFNYYKSVFGGEFAMLNRFAEMPPQSQTCEISCLDPVVATEVIREVAVSTTPRVMAHEGNRMQKYLSLSYLGSLSALGVATCCVLPMTNPKQAVAHTKTMQASLLT